MKLITRLLMTGVILVSTIQYVFAENDVNLVRKMKVDENTGIAEVGDLNVKPGINGNEAAVEVMRHDKFKNIKYDWIPVSEVSKFPIGKYKVNFIQNGTIKGFAESKLYYGVSDDDKLVIYFMDIDNKLKVAQDLNGSYDLKDIKGESKASFITGTLLKDGRIHIDRNK